MADPQIEKLLIVQHRDMALQKIEQELSRIPSERAALERTIQTEEANVEAARQSLRNKEVLRHELDTEVKAKENALQRFRMQQLEVKKNDEYRALTHQIEQAEAEILQLEESEIELMLEIDTVREAFEVERDKIRKRIVEQKDQIELLGEREKNLNASAEAARAELEAARSEAEESYLEHYDRVRQMTKRAPYVVPVESHKCGGCHVRVSNEVSRGARNAGETHFCDQCGRLVYI